MDQGLKPRRYAKALYLAAQDRGADAKLYALMKSVADAFAAEPALAKAMQNPEVSDADKQRLILTAAGTTAADAPLLADFIKLLCRNRRIALFHEAALAYRRIYRDEHKICRVEVVAAAQPAPQAEQRLKKLIEAHIGDHTMEYSLRVDPSLIGGFVVNIDNSRLDASIKNELKQLRLNLLGK